jgi:zinc protease
MLRRLRAGLIAGVLTLSACSSSKEVSQDTAVQSDSSADEGSGADLQSSLAEGDTSPPSNAGNDASSNDDGATVVPLPGLLDPSDEPIPDDDENVRTGTLANGLTYYVRHNERPGAKASLRLAIRAGSVNETDEHTGVAHFVEHMLFNGTERYPKNELIDVLRSFGAEFGADINAYTSFDETVYQLDVPNDDESFGEAVTVLEQWLSHATFDPQQVESERGIVIDEWRGSTQTVDGRLFDVAQALYLTGSAYEGRDPIGTEESIARVPQEELKRFYDDWYRPDNAALVIVGDIDVDDAVARIEAQFGDAAPPTPAMPSRPDTAFTIETEPGFALHSDPDQTTVDVEVTLPLPAIEGTGTAAMRASVIDEMIFDALVRRLDGDITAGTAAFDEIFPGTNSFVSSLDAPALYAVTTSDRVEPTLTALLDEYERAHRFGFTASETELVKSSAQAEIDSVYEGRDSIQDTDFADSLVEHFLRSSPYPDPEVLHDVVSQIIADVTPEAIDLRFRARWTNTAPHVIISTPESDAGSMPTADEVLALIAGTPQRAVEARPDAAELPDELMLAPTPVEPTDRRDLLPAGDPLFDPVEVTFPNGVRVIATSNDIEAGQVGFQAISPGGSSLVADADVIDALYAADIVTSSGVAEFTQTELEQILADRDVTVQSWIEPYTDNFAGSAASADIESLFQLVHLYMTQPRFDQVALTQTQRSEGPTIDDPASAPDVAGYDALSEARYGDELRYSVLPTPEQFAALDLDGVERVWRDRFGNASDWVFVFAGDIDLDQLFDLASSYLGTLPGTGVVEQWVDVEDPPPPGVVKNVVQAGTGETSNVTLLFTTPVADVTSELRATIDVATEVLNTRLTDVIREQLGESYSPYAYSFVNSDPEPQVLTYVQVSGDPERIEAVGDLVVEQFADIATNGPTEREFSGAYATVQERYGFVDNGTFITELVNDAIWPKRDLADYLDLYFDLGLVTPESVQRFVADHVPAGQYIQVATLPR